jgi:hypothetical protein
MLGIRVSFRDDSKFSPAEAVFGSQLILPGQFVNTAESLSPSFLKDLQTAMTGRPPPPPTRHNSASAPSTLPEELLLARFVLARQDGAQPPLSTVYDGPYRVLERSTHFFLLEMGERTDKRSILSLKAARTPIDTEPAKPPRRGRPVAQVPPVCTPPPSQRGRPRQVTFSFPPHCHQHRHRHQQPRQRPAARFATPGRRTDPTSEPAASELGGDLWWRTFCSSRVSGLDRHMTCYTSPYAVYMYILALACLS